VLHRGDEVSPTQILRPGPKRPGKERLKTEHRHTRRSVSRTSSRALHLYASCPARGKGGGGEGGVPGSKRGTRSQKLKLHQKKRCRGGLVVRGRGLTGNRRTGSGIQGNKQATSEALPSSGTKKLEKRGPLVLRPRQRRRTTRCGGK